MNKKSLMASSIITASLLFMTGCSSSNNSITPSINFKVESKSLNTNYFSVQKNDSLSLVIYNLNKKGFNIVDYPKNSDKLIFKTDINKLNLRDALIYLNDKYDMNLFLNVKGDSELVYIKDKKNELKKIKNKKRQKKIEKLKEEKKIKEVFNIPISVDNEIRFNELFNNLRYLGFNIKVKIEGERQLMKRVVSDNSRNTNLNIEELPKQNFAEVGAIGVASDTGNNLSAQQDALGNVGSTSLSTSPSLDPYTGNTAENNNINTVSSGSSSSNLKSLMEKPPVFNPTSQIGEYKGSLLDLLDEIKHTYKLFITYEPYTKTIEITDKKMGFYDLKLQPVQIQSSENLKNLVVDTIKPFEDLEKELRTMISTENFNLNRTDGTLSIYGNQGDLSRTELIINKFNSIYGKSLVIDFKIYEVALNDQNQFGIDYSNLAKRYGSFAAEVSTNLTTNIISNTANSLTIQNRSGYDAGNEKNKGIVKFLNQYGKTSVVTRPILETINNLPVTMNIVQQKDYVKSIKETKTSTTTETSTTDDTLQDIETDTINSGFQLTLYPRIEKDGIKIALKPLISSLDSLEKYEYGSEDERKSIQLKTISTKDFAQNILIKDNETVMIGGYIINKTKGDKSALPLIGKEDSFLDIVGAAKNKEIEKSELIFTISARIK